MATTNKEKFILPPLGEEELDYMPFGVCVINKKGVIEYVNPALIKISGLEGAGKIIGQNALSFPACQKHGLDKYLRQGLAGKFFQMRDTESALFTEKKKIIKYYIGIPIKNEKGAVEKLLCLVEDVSECSWAAESWQAEKEKAQHLLDIAGVMIVALDNKGVVTLINKKGCEILGYELEEIIGKNWFENFLPLETRQKVREVFSALMMGGGEDLEYFENEVLTKKGEKRMIAWHNALLKDKDGRIQGTLSSGEDITERKKTEEELRQRNKELERFNRLMVGRELKMIELKKKIKELEAELKKAKKK